MSAHATVRWAGESLHLLPEHALWWPAGRTLFIADLHLAEERPQASGRFFHFLDTVAAGADALYILGDLFEY